MIKNIMLSICLLTALSGVSHAQDSLLYGIFPLRESRIVYEKIVTLRELSKNELFKRSQEWALNLYKPQKDTNQVDEKEHGSLLYKGYFTVLFNEPATNVAAEWQCWQTVKILCRDNNVNIIVTDLEQRVPSGYGTISIMKMERMKSKLDSLPKSAFFGKSNKELYWKTELLTFKEIDEKIKGLMASFEQFLKEGKRE